MKNRVRVFILVFGVVFLVTLISSWKAVPQLAIVHLDDDDDDATTALRIKEAFLHSWKGYKDKAWGRDEYYPISGSGRSMVKGGMGWIIVDALDTMILMNMTDEVAIATDWIEHHLNYDIDHEVNVFETTIRMLGGLLSAYYLAGNRVYLDRAVDLGNRILGAFHHESGIPFASVNLHKMEGVRSHSDAGSSSTAEVSTLQLELNYLSHLTGDDSYAEAGLKVMKALAAIEPKSGLVPIFINPYSGGWQGNTIRLGSRADSYYEYLLKQWIQSNYRLEWMRDMYDRAMDGVKEHLVAYSSPSRLTFIGELPMGMGDKLSPKMDHLVCFIGGNLVLGATRGHPIDWSTYPKGWRRRDLDDLDLGMRLTETCYKMYNNTASGLAPEIVYFNTQEGAKDDFIIQPRDRHNLMRPETVESLYILYTLTGNQTYKAWALEIFNAFEKWSRTPGGHTSLNDVTSIPPSRRDNMESFWLAETLKYLYLIFDASNVDLSKVVLNTEAHILPRLF